MLDMRPEEMIGPDPVGEGPRSPERPTRAQAEQAVRTLIRWAGDDPDREGLRDTPARVVKAYGEWFAGYGQDPAQVLSRTFDETGGYRDVVLLRDITLTSICEHHMAPIRGVAHVAYLPGERIVGLSKLARLVEVFGRRLQVQERLTVQIARALDACLRPRGVAVMIEAAHDCMSSRGVRQHGGRMVTRELTGAFEADPWRSEIMSLFAAGGTAP